MPRRPVRVDDRRVRRGLTQAQRDARKRAAGAMQRVTERRVLPRIKRIAPGVVAAAITAKANRKGAFITTQGPRVKDRITGLLNWGGTVRTFIRPKRKKALRIGPNVVRAAVYTKRRYRGKKFIERGLPNSPGEVEDFMRDEMTRAIQEAL